MSEYATNKVTEWIKGLLAVPFVLHSQPTGVFEEREGSVEQMAEGAHRRYEEIMLDVERMIDDHSALPHAPHLALYNQVLPFPQHNTASNQANVLTPPVAHQAVNLHGQSKLKLLVPSIGTFFTRLPLAAAFRYQDRKRFISSRRFVPPSFNDIRLILNTAQLMGLTASGSLELATFDGDVTLYDDGKSLETTNPVIERIIGEYF